MHVTLLTVFFAATRASNQTVLRYKQMARELRRFVHQKMSLVLISINRTFSSIRNDARHIYWDPFSYINFM
jgi:hypothetical protein